MEGTFAKGVALSVWQNSSDHTSQWTQFVKDRNYFGQKRFKAAWERSNGFWDNYAHDLQLVKDLGGNSFRFSFEWARVEPVEGQIDETAIARYHAMLDCMDSLGISANATLHHFTHPLWFEKMGGFEDEANIPHFVRYAETMFRHFGSRIKLWATFNEPTCFAFCGYIMGLWAPGMRGGLVRCGQVLGNLLRSHVAAYHAMKALPGGPEARIGLVHQHIRFAAKCGSLAKLWVMPLVNWMTYWFATDVVLEFFQHGRFRWRCPWLGQVISFNVPGAQQTVDWWGINYYTRPCITGTFQMAGLGPEEPMTDMHMPMVPSDLRYHILHASQALGGPPIYITETGLADRRDALRGRLIEAYYQQVLHAIADGADVRGVYYWTLMDNIEWHHGFHMKFGLYEWHPASADGVPEGSTAAPRVRLREGSKALQRVHSEWPDDLAALRQYAQQAVAGLEGRSGSGATATGVRGLSSLHDAPMAGSQGDLGVALLEQHGGGRSDVHGGSGGSISIAVPPAL